MSFNPVSEYHFTLYSAFYLAATLVSFSAAFIGWKRSSVKGAADLAMMTTAAGIWTFFIIFETGAVTETEKILWSKLCYLGAASTPVLYFIFVMRFTDKDKFIKGIRIIYIFIIPVTTFIMALTNEKHLLLWSGYSSISPATNIMEYYHGAWYWAGYVGYNYILLMLSTVYLFRFIAVHRSTFRSQGIVVFIAGLCPWIASIFYITGINPVPGLDLTSLSIVLTGVLFLIAILFIRFLDLVPVAREILFETLTDGILALDEKNRIQYINDRALSMLGITDKNIIGISAKNSGAADTVLLDAVTDRGSADNQEIKTGNRTIRITRQEIINYRNSLLIILHDITAFKQIENSLRESEEKHRLLIENSHDIIYMLTPEGIFSYVSPAWTTLLGHPVSQVVNKSFLPFVHPEDIPACLIWLQKVIETGERQEGIEYRVRHLDGTWYWHTSSAVPLKDSTGTVIGFEGTARDISERKQVEEALRQEKILLLEVQKELEESNSKLKELNLQLEQLSIIDELSGLYNRRYFDNTLINEFNRHKRMSMPLSLIMCDIDYFKKYNDTLGHQAGDRCIELVAGALKKGATRPSDTVARYGGEEFVVILPQTDRAGCMKVAEQIQREVLSLAVRHPDSTVSANVTVSISITTIIPDEAVKYSDIVALADKALYDSKNNGRNTISERTFSIDAR